MEGLSVSSLLIVGADHLGVILDKLTSVGFDEVLHLNGRKGQMVKKDIPENISCILVLTDFVNHNLSTVIKKRAKKFSQFKKSTYLCTPLQKMRRLPPPKRL